ncbi:TraB/GumN family protein [Oleiagrimonas sp. C23AA]|uniref:TraB/GumN family protein n=1 Tax=Oleiagrimonas sp. C23AA TaxID=2719047 RepID=UPI00141E631A|nr:TraB/GumN family protein [Oleiagrimonas sp. C23AA]NII10020.1 TraB/GumN family protein [Oleiagrimonas sp. C23AA]
MDIVNIRRRKFVRMLAGTTSLGIGGLQPFALLAKPIVHHWPLWSIRRGGRSIYLTAETPPQATDWHDARIERLLPRCSSIWTETNNVYRQSQATLIQRYGIDVKRPLKAWLDVRDNARLARAAADCKVKLEELAPYEPWIVGSLLQESFYRVSGWKGKSAREVLTKRAVRAGMPWHCEFKDKDDVFAWFGAMTPLQNTQFLRYVLDEVLAGPAADARIFKAWGAGQRAPAEAEVAKYELAYPELARRLTFARNRAWLPRLEMMLDTPGTPLIVVGLYHMVGASGLLALARQRGWSVEVI